MKKNFFLFIFSLLSLFSLEAKLPELSQKDVRAKVEEILKLHVAYKTLSPMLIQRSLLNFIDEFDGAKVYFVESEIEPYLHPQEPFLAQMLEQFQHHEFQTYEEIHTLLEKAILRRNRLEEEIKTLPLLRETIPSDFVKLTWCQSEDELKERLHKIHSLQQMTAEKLEPEFKEKFLQYISKRKRLREEELKGKDLETKKKLIYSTIVKSMAAALDSQTFFFTPQEAGSFLIQVQQRLFGIGAKLVDDLAGLMVVEIIEGGPACRGGALKVKDRIIAVDGEPIAGMDLTEAVDMIRGPENTPVQLTVLRPIEGAEEEKILIEIQRGEVVLKESRFDASLEPFGDGVIVHLALHAFYQDPQSSSASDLEKVLEDYKKEHKIKGVVLDLRNNTGGMLSQAVAVTGLFLGKGIVVSMKNYNGEIQHLRNVDPIKAWMGPLVVLINKVSASASEIVAQTLQDYGRAIVVGDPHSFGKGSFQFFDLAQKNQPDPKGEFKVTGGIYYTTSGKTPQLVGVQSDIVIPGPFSEYEIGECFSKFPLQSENIAENFEDTLSDIPLNQREKVKKYYRFNLQPKITTFTKHTEILKKNSQKRVDNNKNYQAFLKALKKDEKEAESENFGQNDLQLQEAYNITKDLVLLAS